MCNPSNNLRRIRPDLTPFLFHFTKGENSAANLKSILAQKKLKSTKGYICFTDSPLSMLDAQFKYMGQFPTPMYSQYGIGFKRDLLIKECNCRPVIYGDSTEQSLIDQSLQWRFEPLDVITHDYTWLREWRVSGNEFDFSELNPEEVIVIAPNETNLREIIEDVDWDVEFDYDHSTKLAYPYISYTIRRKWKGVPLSQAASFKDDNELEQLLTEQHIGEELK